MPIMDSMHFGRSLSNIAESSTYSLQSQGQMQGHGQGQRRSFGSEDENPLDMSECCLEFEKSFV